MNEEITMQDTKMEEDPAQEMQVITTQLQTSPEVTRIADSLDVSSAQNIMKFGQETAVEISKFSDKILSTINQSLLKKYETMDKEVSQIYVEIKKYESEIGKTNDMLSTMYEKNIEYYKELEKYILAGNVVIEKMKNEIIPQYEKKASETNNELDNFNLQNVKESLEMLEQRVYDLELAKMVAMQSAPQIKLIQRGNYNLLRKIGSAFVVTIPVFKTGMIQAVAIKRQKVQADSMKALDERTNEMLMKNAENISKQSVDIAKLSGSSSIKIETLESTFNTIMNGIEETMRIEDENKLIRQQGKDRILQLQDDMKNKLKSL